jgi:regulator of protease activity HflC (stomatin/prohibitin superfamily)
MNVGFFVLTHQQEAKILERFGKFYKILEPGFNFKLPLIDEVSYHHSLKEQVIDIDG